ncbi:MAG: ABC transporter ATP-binding protein/permease [Ignavibacteria bacterium]|nr:ABC transporter ATP-binding protein/permease [Ignavibacteria bacterium]
MKSLLSLKKYFARYKTTIYLGFLFIFLSNITSVYVPLFIRDGIDELRRQISSPELIKYASLIVGVTFVSGVFRFLIRQTIIVTSRKIEFDLRNDFWSHLQKLSLRYYQNTKTGDIMAHATNDINAVRNFVGPAVMYSFDTFTLFVFTLALMFSIDVELTFLSLLPFPVLSIFVYYFGKKIHILFTKIQEHFSILTAKAQENLNGIRIIKAYVREESEINHFRKLSYEYFRKNINKIKVDALFHPVLFLTIGSSIIIIMWFGGMKVINGNLSLGELTAFVLYMGYLIWPAIAFGWITNLTQQAAASQKRLNSIFAIEPEIKDSNLTDYSINSLKGEIEFRNVSFRYRDNLPFVLKNINLKIPAGSTYAIIGHTGCGKTSFVNLLARFYDVTEGQILIDGYDIRTIPLKVLREEISFVQQETFLFSDTLKNNIAYGLNGITSEDEFNHRIEEAIRIAHLIPDIESFPKGIETIIGERGITLSGGQKQRTSIARAVAKGGKILILDDCLSAVDTNTEEIILSNLKKFMKGRTSIIISHRISTIKDADLIIVLDKGTIAEKGTHEELLALDGIYSRIYQKQLLEKELEEI